MTSPHPGRDLVVLAALLLLPAAPAVGGDDSVRLSLREYIARLDEIAAAIDQSNDKPSPRVSALVGDAPGVWQVETPQKSFEIKTDGLVRDIRLWRSTEYGRGPIASDVRLMRTEAAGFEAPARPVTSEHAALTSILGRTEFRGVHGPTWLDEVRQRVLEWMGAFLRPIIRSSVFPAASRALIYVLAALSAVALLLWMRKWFQRVATVPPSALEPRSAPASEWPSWFAEAESAAGRECWDEAIHYLYWCGILFLESKGAWRPDRSRTPREYLRLLPAGGPDHSALTALTRRFERVWYGAEVADGRLFADAITSLKRIGCPPA